MRMLRLTELTHANALRNPFGIYLRSFTASAVIFPSLGLLRPSHRAASAQNFPPRTASPKTNPPESVGAFARSLVQGQSGFASY